MLLYTYLHILRRYLWLLILPLLVALLSGALVLLRPARYQVIAGLLVARSQATPGSAGLTDQREDRTSLDLSAIVHGVTFRADLAQELTRRGLPADQLPLNDDLTLSYEDRVVSVIAEAAQPEAATTIADATIALIKTNGLRYWGDPSVTPEHPGLDVVVLEPPGAPVRLNGPRAMILEVGARVLLALLAAIGLAFALNYLAHARQSGRSSIDEQQSAEGRLTL